MWIDLQVQQHVYYYNLQFILHIHSLGTASFVTNNHSNNHHLIDLESIFIVMLIGAGVKQQPKKSRQIDVLETRTSRRISCWSLSNTKGLSKLMKILSLGLQYKMFASNRDSQMQAANQLSTLHSICKVHCAVTIVPNEKAAVATSNKQLKVFADH